MKQPVKRLAYYVAFTEWSLAGFSTAQSCGEAVRTDTEMGRSVAVGARRPLAALGE